MTPPTESLGQGIHRVTVSLPFASPRAINCYVIEGEHGVTVIDCGVNEPERLAELNTALESTLGESFTLDRFIGTHMHPDHMGGAQSFMAPHEAEFVMHRLDRWVDRRIQRLERPPGRGCRAGPRPRSPSGGPGDPRCIVAAASLGRHRDRANPSGFRRRPDPRRQGPDARGDPHPQDITPRTYVSRTVAPAGCSAAITFSPGSRRSFPTIRRETHSPNTSKGSNDWSESTPVSRFPAHGETVEQGRARARQIALHHERRLGAMTQVTVPNGATAWQVMTDVFRPDLYPDQKYLAFQETLAHLEHLVNRGKLNRTLDTGTWIYAR